MWSIRSAHGEPESGESKTTCPVSQPTEMVSSFTS